MRLLFLTAALALATPTSYAQDAAGVVVEAKTVSSSRKETERWSTSWGSYDRSIYRSRSISATVRADQAGEAKVICYWIGSIIGHRNRRKIITETTEITLKAKQPSVIEFAELFVEDDTKYNALRVRQRDGLKYYGWVVRVVDSNGRTLATTAAREPMIQLVAWHLRQNPQPAP